MNDTPLKGTTKLQERERLILEFIDIAQRDVELMRSASGDLDRLDLMSWRRVELTAHNLAARAGALKLGVLERAALELEQFALAVLSNDNQEKSKSVDSGQVAIETIALELQALQQ